MENLRVIQNDVAKRNLAKAIKRSEGVLLRPISTLTTNCCQAVVQLYYWIDRLSDGAVIKSNENKTPCCFHLIVVCIVKSWCRQANCKLCECGVRSER